MVAITVPQRRETGLSPSETPVPARVHDAAPENPSSLRQWTAAGGRTDLDEQTNLPDQRFFAEEVERQMARSTGAAFTLHIVRIDNFSVVNNAFGPETGRQLLQVCANRLRNSLNGGCLAGRYGADGFAVLQRTGKECPEVAALARQILTQLTAPYLIWGHRISIAATIGIASRPDDGGDFAALAHRAGLAVDHAFKGGQPIARYHSDILADARRIAALDIDLRNALATQQFFLQFQPQVSLLTGKLSGAEALVRWRCPDGTVMPPDTFLPYAEESGLIAAIDEWVLSQACHAARRWHDSGMRLRISVNMSSARFAQRHIPALVTRVLQETGLEPRYLDIELTETAVMHDIERVGSDLASLRSLGVSVSIDDFGVGYSSLRSIKQLRADRLKIDRDFVRNLAVSGSDRAILRTIIHLGHELDFEVVAEGVETADQLTILRAERCDEVQGFLFARPMSMPDFMAYAQRFCASGDCHAG